MKKRILVVGRGQAPSDAKAIDLDDGECLADPALGMVMALWADSWRGFTWFRVQDQAPPQGPSPDLAFYEVDEHLLRAP